MDSINCIHCGRPLQSIFFGIGHSFTGGVFVQDEDESQSHWLVCINPDCPDGKKNVNLQSPSEVEL
jgi:hypothetical protein